MLAVVAAVLVSSVSATNAVAAVACGAVGHVQEGPNGSFIYTIEVLWDFEGAALPEEINLVLPTLLDCEFYQPGNALQSHYVQPLSGTSTAQPGCLDVAGAPSSVIDWVGAMQFEDQFCWIMGPHAQFTNTGDTPDCLPLDADTGVFVFSSYGAPLPTAAYYDAVVIRAGDECIVCDYEGPMPDCNLWAPVERVHWTTIKALYR
jgi:hypothetical protein